MKLMTIVLAAAMLTGCASVVCTEANVEKITDENSRLLVQKAEIDGYLAGGEMPNEKFSRIQRGALVSARVRDYNQSVDALNYQSNQFNTMCIKGKNGGL